MKVRWFPGQKGIVGVVQIKSESGEVEYRIGVVDGFMERMDVLQLVAWGVSFPKDAGDALIEKE